MWNIYSIGDAQFLTAVLNGLALLQGSGNIEAVVKIGLIVAFGLAALKGILTGGRILPFQEVLLSWVVYMFFFGTTATVTIENAYTGAVTTVSNVPAGVAATGSIISRIGFLMTQAFEQAFGTTDRVTEHGFVNSLKLLDEVQQSLFSRADIGAANSPAPFVDLENSVVNYVKDCSLAGVDINQKSLDELFNNPDPLQAIRFDSDVYGTKLYLTNPATEPTCTEAFPALSDYLTSTYLPALRTMLATKLGLSDPAEIGTAIARILPPGVDADNFILAAAMRNMIDLGIAAQHESTMHWTRAAMIEQAIAQRNVQWAAQQTMFESVARPLMSFFEAFMYAAAPVAAFAIALGMVGIRVAAQYLKLSLWVQMWLPMLAIVNLYVETTVQSRILDLEAAGFLLPSFHALDQLQATLSTWIATGGLLASSTPAIALMLLYGAAVTATHLASQVRGQDHVNERIMEPDRQNTPPLVSFASPIMHTPLGGYHTSGAREVAPSFTFGTDYSAAIQASHSTLLAREQAFATSLRNALGERFATQATASVSERLGETLRASHAQADRFVMDMARSIQTEFSSAFEQAEKKGTGTGARVAFGPRSLSAEDKRDPDAARLIPTILHAISTNNQANVSAQLRRDFGMSEREADRVASGIVDRVSHSEQAQAELARAIAADTQQGRQSVFTRGLDESRQRELAERASEAVRAADQYQELSARRTSAGTRQTRSAIEVGQRFASDPGLRGKLEDAITLYGINGDVERLAKGKYLQYFGPGTPGAETRARMAAALALMAGHERSSVPFSDDVRKQIRNRANALLGEAFGGGTVPEVAAGAAEAAHRGLDAHPKVTGPAVTALSVQASVSAGQADVAWRISGREGQVRAAYGDFRSLVEERGEAMTGRVAGAQAAVIANEIREQLADRSVTRASAEHLHRLGETVQGALKTTTRITGRGIGYAAAAFVQTLQRGGSLDDAVKAAGQGFGEAAVEVTRAVSQGVVQYMDRVGATEEMQDYVYARLVPGGGLIDTASQRVDARYGPEMGPMVREMLDRYVTTGNEMYVREVTRYDEALRAARADTQ